MLHYSIIFVNVKCQDTIPFFPEFDEMKIKPKYLIHDRDCSFTKSFDKIFNTENIEIIKLPSHSPDLNAYAERWIRSIREECLGQMIFIGENHFRKALRKYENYYNNYRPHQGIDNNIPYNVFHKIKPKQVNLNAKRKLRCKKFSGGLYKHYYWEEVKEQKLSA